MPRGSRCVAGSNACPKAAADAAVTFIRLVAYRREFVSPGKSSVLRAESAPHWIDGARHWNVGHRLNPDLDVDSAEEAIWSRLVAGTAPLSKMQWSALLKDLLPENFSHPTCRGFSEATLPHADSFGSGFGCRYIGPWHMTQSRDDFYEAPPDEKAISAFTDTLHERSSRHAPLYRQTDFKGGNRFKSASSVPPRGVGAGNV